MGKKLYVSYQREKQRKKKEQSTTREKYKHTREIPSLKKMPEEKIDLSDIPELDLNKLGQPLVGKFYQLVKSKRI